MVNFLNFRLVIMSRWLRYVFLEIMRTHRRIWVKLLSNKRIIIIASNLLRISVLNLLLIKIKLRNRVLIRSYNLSRPDSWTKLLIFMLSIWARSVLCFERVGDWKRLLISHHLKYGYIALSLFVRLHEVLIWCFQLNLCSLKL